MIYLWQKELWKETWARQDELPHALLLHGPEGIGKLAFAEHLCQAMLCESRDRAAAPCGQKADGLADAGDARGVVVLVRPAVDLLHLDLGDILGLDGLDGLGLRRIGPGGARGGGGAGARSGGLHDVGGDGGGRADGDAGVRGREGVGGGDGDYGVARGRGSRRARCVGDTRFAGSIGRPDLPGGSATRLLQSIADVLMAYPDDTIVHPGHGPDTTIGRERVGNPYL